MRNTFGNALWSTSRGLATLPSSIEISSRSPAGENGEKVVTVLTQLIKYLVPRKVDEGRSRLVGLRAGTGRAAGFAEGFGEGLLQKHLPEHFRDKPVSENK